MSRLPEIKQFKLSNGEELICEVIQWDDEDSSAIIIRAGMQLVSSTNIKTGIKLFTFKPWLSFNEDPTVLQSINATHVIAEGTPSKDMLVMYTSCLTKLKRFVKEKNDYPPIDLDEYGDLTDEELQQVLEEEYDRVLKDDSATSNIIQFPKTFH
tara:strand:+ start:115 stop:576 length:462 start_codon:yes stop_codon:yes gene_type:complete